MADESGRVYTDVDVMVGAQWYGEIVARAICKQCPGLDVAALTEVCAAEVFMAAKDMRVLAEIEGEQATAALRARSEGRDAA